MSVRYDQPGVFSKSISAVIRRLAEVGVSIQGTQALRVRGRRTGEMRSVVVNVMEVDGVEYLLSPRGNTQWARNARAAGEVEIGPRWRRRLVRITEIADDAKEPLLKRYLDRWWWEVKGVFGGVSRSSTAAESHAAGVSIPVFALMG